MPDKPDETAEFRTLMRRVGQGSEEAAWELVRCYGDAIRRAVRRALNRRLRAKFDSSDFVQFVWASFFRARYNLGRFDRPEQLVAFLVKMAQNKVGMEVRRRFLTERYNINRERPLGEVMCNGGSEVPDHQPLPMEVAIARERWDRMLQDRPEHYRKIIQLRLQGYTYQAIADSLHLAQSTVRRFLKKLRHETVAR